MNTRSLNRRVDELEGRMEPRDRANPGEVHPAVRRVLDEVYETARQIREGRER